jgi:hypothetical protein
LDVLLMRSTLFSRTRPRCDAARAAIIADPVDRRVVDDGTVHISIVDDRGVDIDYRRIISEMPAYPIAAGKARTVIPASIIDTAIEADMRPPITGIPAIDPTGITPVTRRPKEADLRRFRPISRYPIISIVIIICPVPRDPQISVNRTDWLRIHRNNRRPDMNADAHTEYLRISPLSRQTTDS